MSSMPWVGPILFVVQRPVGHTKQSRSVGLCTIATDLDAK